VEEGASIGFQRCAFEGAEGAESQLWQYRDGKFHSLLNHNRCITVDYGQHLSPGTWARMHDCDMDTDLNEFLYNVETDFIAVKDNADYCLTNSGNNPNSSDNIVVEKCKNNLKFFFTYQIGYVGNNDEYINLNNDDSDRSGCLVVKDENPKPAQPLILGSCKLNHSWRYDRNGLFHSALDDDMCLQAGTKKNAQIKVGSGLRLYPCDKNNKKQQFDYNNVDIRLRGYDNLCIGYRGANGDVGVDPIVLRKCKTEGTNWSQD